MTTAIERNPIPESSRSLLQMHLDHLDGKQVLPEDEAAHVREFTGRVEQLDLKTTPLWYLKRPMRKIMQHQSLPTLFALAAGLLVFLWPKSEVPEWTAKGGMLVNVVVEQPGGQRHLWQSDEKLQSGDKVNAQIRVDAPATAYLIVYDGSGKILQQSDEIIANALVLNPTSTAHFGRGIELIGSSEGETLMIVVCFTKSSDVLASDQQTAVLKKMLEQNLPRDNLQTDLPAPCSQRIFTLRGNP